MKLKNILIISIVTNVVLLGTLAYIQNVSIDPKTSPPIIYFVSKNNPESIATAVKAAVETPAQ